MAFFVKTIPKYFQISIFYSSFLPIIVCEGLLIGPSKSVTLENIADGGGPLVRYR